MADPIRERQKRAPLYGATRDLRLAGERAVAWFAENGWQARAISSVVPHVIVDEIVGDAVTVRRLWHTPLALEAMTTSDATPATTVVLQVDRHLRVRLPGTDSRTLGPFGAAVVPRSAGPQLIADDHTARVEVTLTSRPHLAHATEGEVWARDETSASWTIVVSLVNAVLNSTVVPASPGYDHLQDAIESATRALITQFTAERLLPRPPRPHELAIRAEEIIRRHAADPAFTVDGLARMMNVSRRHLARVLTALGAPASARIRAERVRLARQLLTGPAVGAHGRQVAQLSGFPSVRTLREAIAREDEESPLRAVRP